MKCDCCLPQIQAMARMWKARKAYKGRLQFFGDHVSYYEEEMRHFTNLFLSQEAEVVKIQSFWRAKKAKKDYTQLG